MTQFPYRRNPAPKSLLLFMLVLALVLEFPSTAPTIELRWNARTIAA